jgi:phage baseplate assembly protein W
VADVTDVYHATVSSTDFVGSGWSYPAGVDATGAIALVSGDTEVAQAMRLILGTAFGERPMRPEFGCGIHDLVFATTDSTLGGLISHEVRASLLRWEPRIDVADVVVTFDPERPGLAFIDVSYVLSSSNDRRNLVVPFYSIPEED